MERRYLILFLTVLIFVNFTIAQQSIPPEIVIVEDVTVDKITQEVPIDDRGIIEKIGDAPIDFIRLFRNTFSRSFAEDHSRTYQFLTHSFTLSEVYDSMNDNQGTFFLSIIISIFIIAIGIYNIGNTEDEFSVKNNVTRVQWGAIGFIFLLSMGVILYPFVDFMVEVNNTFNQEQDKHLVPQDLGSYLEQSYHGDNRTGEVLLEETVSFIYLQGGTKLSNVALTMNNEIFLLMLSNLSIFALLFIVPRTRKFGKISLYVILFTFFFPTIALMIFVSRIRGVDQGYPEYVTNFVPSSQIPTPLSKEAYVIQGMASIHFVIGIIFFLILFLYLTMIIRAIWLFYRTRQQNYHNFRKELHHGGIYKYGPLIEKEQHRKRGRRDRIVQVPVPVPTPAPSLSKPSYSPKPNLENMLSNNLNRRPATVE